MSVLYIVLPVALLVVGAGVAAFVWAARRGQFDDLVTPELRMLQDDDPPARRPSDPPASVHEPTEVGDDPASLPGTEFV